jgi:hypothetical protein
MKSVKNRTIITLLLTLLVVIIVTVSCDPDFFGEGCHSHIQLTNNGNVDICTDDNYYGYPDTTIHNINPLKHGQKTTAGTINRASCIGGAGVCIEARFIKSEFNDNPCEYISIFIFDANFMEQNINNEDFMIRESMALQRYDLTLEDLNSLNWTIFYPPNERMKDVKMYPPYGK